MDISENQLLFSLVLWVAYRLWLSSTSSIHYYADCLAGLRDDFIGMRHYNGVFAPGNPLVFQNPEYAVCVPDSDAAKAEKAKVE